MRRAVLAMVLLLAAAPAFSGAPRADLHLRARLLLREIRTQSTASKKDTARLRSELSALKAENSASPDEKVTAHLLKAEANLALVDAGTDLPPPSIEEAISPADLPDRDAVAQPALPAPPPPAPVFQNAGPAASPEAAGPVFDGSGRHGATLSRSVSVPPEAPEADLDEYLTLTDAGQRMAFVLSVSKGLLEKMKEKDDGGMRASQMAERIAGLIASHPQRENFISIRLRVPADGKLHLIYRLRAGGAVDEILGAWDDLSKYVPVKPIKVKPGRKPKKSPKKKGGDDGGDGGGGGGGGGGGHKKHGGGHKKVGGGDDGGGGGGGAGAGGEGAHSHAKAPHSKGGGSMFDGGDGGDSSADSAAPGGGGGMKGHGRGGGHGGHKGHSRDTAGGGDSGGGGDDAGASSFGSGRAHASAGKSISGDDGGGSGSGSGSRKKRGAKVPMPKDFTSRGVGSRLDEDGEGRGGGRGSSGGLFGGFHMSHLGLKEFHHDAPATASKAVTPPPVLAQVKAPATALSSPAGSAPAAAPGAAPLSAPFTAETDLRDAVAAHAAVSPRAAIPLMNPPPAAPASQPTDDHWPFGAACAAAAALGLGAYAFRRSRRVKA